MLFRSEVTMFHLQKTFKSSLTMLTAIFAVMVINVGLTPSSFGEEVSSIARGGLLYDKWYKVIKAEKPTETHPAWPASNTKKKGDATQRCKACHGWDLMGKDGAYASGSYMTGIKGIKNMQGASVDRSEERRVGKECSDPCRSWWSAEL